MSAQVVKLKSKPCEKSEQLLNHYRELIFKDFTAKGIEHQKKLKQKINGR